IGHYAESTKCGYLRYRQPEIGKYWQRIHAARRSPTIGQGGSTTVHIIADPQAQVHPVIKVSAEGELELIAMHHRLFGRRGHAENPACLQECIRFPALCLQGKTGKAT